MLTTNSEERMDLAAVERMLAYHHWAYDRLLAAVAVLPAEALERALGGSFGSLGGLLAHVLGAELLWIERWRGRSPAGWPAVPPCDDADDFRREWERVKAAERELLAATPPDGLARPFAYVNLQGEPFAYPTADVVLHLANHGTYHRGQLAHMLRDLGRVPPMTDYLIYLDELNAAS